MTYLISFPFRLTATGTVAVLEDGTDEYYSEELAVLILTRPEERPLVPTYGLTDPTFDSEFNEHELEDKVEMFGPPVKIVDVDTSYPYDGLQEVEVSFESHSEDDDEDYSDDEDDYDYSIEGVLDGFA